MKYIVTITSRLDGTDSNVLVQADSEGNAIVKAEQFCYDISAMIGKPLQIRNWAFSARLIDAEY
jgi:hypothetical protein